MGNKIETAEHETSQKHRKLKSIPKKAYIPTIVAVVAVVAICIAMLCNIQAEMLKAAENQFHLAFTTTRKETYDKLYDWAYEKGEKKYHVSNRIIIDIDGIKETETLEVLDVSASDVKEYKFDNELTKPTNIFLELISFVTGSQTASAPPQAVVWLEGSCIGTYEVDLKSSEIIVDNENKYVLVSLPSPSLKFISHDFEVKYFNNGTKPFCKVLDGSNQWGLDAAIHDTADMTSHLHDMLNDRDQSDLAREQAETLIENLIRELNSDIPDLDIEVKFFS